jgi:transposase-like protein
MKSMPKKIKKIKEALRIVSQDVRIEHGVCPYCRSLSPLLFLYKSFYRCALCGEESEQYVNGVIKYIPISLHKRATLISEKNNG